MIFVASTNYKNPIYDVTYNNFLLKKTSSISCLFLSFLLHFNP